MNKLKKLLIILTTIYCGTALAAPTHSGISARIISGTKAPENAYPWMVALLSKYNGLPTDEHYCGGTLISPQYVLTAAHCVDIPDVENTVDVLVGQNKLSSGTGMRVPIRGVVIHPQYDSLTLRNDFALIKLDAIVPYTPIEVASPFSPELYNAGSLAKVLGWGMMDPQLPILPDALREATLPLVSSEACLETDGRWVDPSVMICAGTLPASGDTELKPDACYGDSGGPLAVFTSGRYVQIGTVSWGFGCASSKTYGVYAKTASAYDFISSRPTIAPRPANYSEVLKISGALQVGETVTVTRGQWKGDAPTKYYYNWYSATSSDGFDPTLVATTEVNLLKLSSEFANKYLYVTVSTTNDAGDSWSSLVSEVVFINPEPVIVTGTSTQDISAPTVLSAGEQCAKRNCTIYVMVEDSAPSSGIASVSARLKAVIPAKKNASGKITARRIVYDTLNATSISSTGYAFKIRRGKGIRYTLKVSATDNVGYTSSELAINVKKY